LKGFLIISLALNTTLVVVLASLWRQPIGPGGASVTVEAGDLSPAALESSRAPATDSDLPPAGTTTTTAFHWQVLESTNYEIFVANLRGVGCPERTIRDLIFADAERRYAGLEAEPATPIPFWLAGRALREATRRDEAACLKAQDQLRAQLRRVLGLDWSPDEPELHDVRFQVGSRLVAGPISEEQHEAACRWLLATVEEEKNFQRQRDHLLLEQDQAEWQQIVTDQKARLEKLLPPDAFEELQARTSLLEEAFAGKLLHFEDLELTPTELRRVCLVKNREIGWLESAFHHGRNLTSDEQAAQKIALTAALKNELAPDHFTELVRVQDDAYRNLLAVTRENNLPRSAAQKLMDVRQLAQTEFQRLSTDVNDEATVEALAALQAATTDSVRKIMGREAFDKFTARTGQWVTNVSKL